MEFDFHQFERDLRTLGYSGHQIDLAEEIAAKMIVDVAVAKDSMTRVGDEHGVNYRAAFDPMTYVFAMLSTIARPTVTSLVLARQEVLAAFVEIADEAEFEEL
jgi:hypothetical protein